MEMFTYLTKGTSLEDVSLKISTVRAKVDCLSCDWRGDGQVEYDHVKCPRCRGDVRVLRGQELQFNF